MIVLDCSAAVEIVRKTARGRGFRGLMIEDEIVITSELFHAEVRNAFWKYVRAGLLQPAAAEAYVEAALGLVDVFEPIDGNARESFAEAMRLGHPVHDLLYLTLARRQRATLFTADKRLADLCEQTGVNCTHEIALA